MKHFTEALARDDVLKAVYRVPAITAYNRLEGRPRTDDFTRSLRAEVRDALWFLTRQWQLGELEAEDAASPIDARLATRLAPFDRISLRGGPSEPYDETVPLEVSVEREDFPWTLPARIEAAELFLRRVPAGVRAAIDAAARSKFELDSDPDWPREPDAAGLYRIAGSRGFDGAKLLASHRAGTLPADLGAAPALVGPAADAVASWARRVFGPTFDTPSAPPPAWVPDRLAYDVRIGTAPAANGERALLTAPQYAEALARSGRAVQGRPTGAHRDPRAGRVTIRARHGPRGCIPAAGRLPSRGRQGILTRTQRHV